MDTNRHSISVPFTDAVQESLPPARYKETVSTLLSWLQQCEAKLAAPSAAVTELPIMDQRLKDVQVCFWLFSAYGMSDGDRVKTAIGASI